MLRIGIKWYLTWKSQDKVKQIWLCLFRTVHTSVELNDWDESITSKCNRKWNCYLELRHHESNQVFIEDLFVESCWHSRILSWWKCWIPWRIKEESRIRTNIIPKFENLLGKQFKSIKTPMSEGYHPEIDESSLCNDGDLVRYTSISGCCVWKIVLGWFDIAYTTSAMRMLNLSPREGNLKGVERNLPWGEWLLIYHTWTNQCTMPLIGLKFLKWWVFVEV